MRLAYLGVFFWKVTAGGQYNKPLGNAHDLDLLINTTPGIS